MDNQIENNSFNHEIDLKLFIQALISNWYWIVIPSLVAAAGMFFYISNQPLLYSASSLISVSSPSLNVNFDTNISTVEENVGSNLQNNDLPNLALSDAIIFELYNQVRSELPPQMETYALLANRLDATTEIRSELIVLSGSFTDPDLSAKVVNEWSGIFVREANKFFEGSVDTSQAFLVEQLQDTAAERNRINAEWASFQARNNIDVLNNQLDALTTLQKSYATRQNNLQLLDYDIKGIKTQINENPNDENVLTDLTLYALQSRAFGTAGNIQFEITTFDALSTSTFEERVSQLDNLELAAQSQAAELIVLIDELTPEILSLKEEITQLTNERADLDAERNIILSTHNSLANKVAEGEIEQNDTTGRVQVASEAISPVFPLSRGRTTTSAIAAIAVSALAVLIILLGTWWREAGKAEKNMLASLEGADKNGYTNGSGRVSEPTEIPAND